MSAFIRFIIRQSGWLALLLFVFAIGNSWSLGVGLWQGNGLHGFVIEPGAKGGPPRVVSVWASFVQMLVSLGLVVLLLGLNIWQRAKISRIVLNPHGMGNNGPNVVLFRSQNGWRPRR